ncbi:MAG: fucosyl transferase [Candidatus Brocadiaceae bacterium]|nr:fucosyl transferase [Candidatus Brocadiaceae bacterium]
MKTPTAHQDQPLISVVMPVYNAERYVADAIRSILEQTYPNFEFIIVDDGSTDGTIKIIREFAGKDSRVRLVYLTHGGGPRAANAGIALAQGEFIARMDADDIALPERFSVQLAWMQKTGVDICGCCVKMFGAEDSLIWFPETHEAIRHELLFRVGVMHPTVIMRADILKTYPYNEQTYHDDYELLTRLAPIYRIGNIQQMLLMRRCHPQQTNVVHHAKFLTERQQFRRPYFHKLFPQATADDYTAIELAAEKKPASNPGELALAGKWLTRLAQTPDNFLRKRMEGRWLATSQRSAHLGLACYRLYRQAMPEFGLATGKGAFKLWWMCALRVGSDSWMYKILASTKRFLSVNMCNQIKQRRETSELT